ncbi:transcriptional regulator [Sulfuricurvum sp.]|uniref:transcriptional regulator n=1 Tax=Sulfuricurvum sp. TaxID=2025608 RepID=UPI002610DF93|nr:transcriptional regulator [Sulfuricurvum sp.]MDD2267451.1 transcriptional regulator [Sulfuricurvum sp.]MDD2782827.1 transcriptional regulator [Sulfuricurvum sp.]
MENENIIKATCKEHGMTYKELGENIGYGEEAVGKASRTGEVSKPMLKAIELFNENIMLKEESKTLDDLKNIFERVISRK